MIMKKAWHRQYGIRRAGRTFCSIGGMVAASALLSGCQKAHQSQFEKQYAEARELVLEECTNDTVGLQHIIDSRIYFTDTGVTNWTAEATVEYVNHVGGIDRTNFHFVFYESRPNWTTQVFLGCMQDYNRLAKEDVEAYQRQIKEIQNGQ